MRPSGPWRREDGNGNARSRSHTVPVARSERPAGIASRCTSSSDPRSQPTSPGAAISEARNMTAMTKETSDIPFRSVADLQEALRDQAYLADRGLGTAIYLAVSLHKPLLLEGEAG